MRLRSTCSALFVLVPSLLLLGACAESDESTAFVVRNSATSSPLASAVVTGGNRFVYVAAENTTGSGTDLNGDTDTADLVAFTALFTETTPTNIGIAIEEAFVVGEAVFLVVDEADDDTEYGGTGAFEIVLLHWDPETETETFVDVIDNDANFTTGVVVGSSLFYVKGSVASGASLTNLRRVDATAPTTPVAINSSDAAGFEDVNIMGEDEGMIFVRASESENATVLNGDADQVDETILCLLDGTSVTGELESTGLALADQDSPLSARLISTGDWVVGCLVDEAEQGVVSLNDHTDTGFTQPFLPGACLGMTEDTDTTDEVLHWIRFGDLVADTVGAIGNTGLAGTGRVLAVGTAVATLSDEADALCDLNGDGDMSDLVARWVDATANAPYVTSDTILRAVETTLPGGAMGLSSLSDRLVCAISEAGENINIDGEVDDHALVAWVDPADGSSGTWTVMHPTGGVGTGVSGEPFAGTTWMAAESRLGRLGMTYSERVPNLNLNSNVACSFIQKDSDAIDALPVWADFGTGPTLDFDGLGFGVSETAPGIEVSGGSAFFRVDEFADNRDWNSDGDKSDLVLFRNPLTSCNPVAMGTSSPGAGGSVTLSPGNGGAFLTSESASGSDLNDDGDMTDFVLRWFSF